MTECLDCALDQCDTCAAINDEWYDGGCCCGYLRPTRFEDDDEPAEPTAPPAPTEERPAAEGGGESYGR